MPVSYIKDAIFDRLSKIGYTTQELDMPSIRGVLKESLLNGENLDVKIFSDREFEVKFSQNSYYQILATDFYYSFQKVYEQSNFLKLSNAKSPVAWLLVSTYYSSFYSAIELSKLFGTYNVYLKKEHCQSIISHTNNSNILQKGNYVGIVNTDVTDYITVRFSATEKSQPHDLAWRNMSRILDFHNIADIRPTKVEQIKFIKSIFNSSFKALQTPNNVRNDWNYSFANAYDHSFCADISDIRTFLNENGRKSILSLPRNFKRNSNKQNNVYAIIYVEAILRQAMIDLKTRILKCN